VPCGDKNVSVIDPINKSGRVTAIENRLVVETPINHGVGQLWRDSFGPNRIASQSGIKRRKEWLEPIPGLWPDVISLAEAETDAKQFARGLPIVIDVELESSCITEHPAFNSPKPFSKLVGGCSVLV